MSICCLAKQLSVCRGIWGSVCPPPDMFPRQDKEGEHICRSLKPMQAGRSGDGGCWGENRGDGEGRRDGAGREGAQGMGVRSRKLEGLWGQRVFWR